MSHRCMGFDEAMLFKGQTCDVKMKMSMGRDVNLFSSKHADFMVGETTIEKTCGNPKPSHTITNRLSEMGGGTTIEGLCVPTWKRWDLTLQHSADSEHSAGAPDG